MSEEKIRWVRPLSVIRGPFRFSYMAIYEAMPADEFWTLILFETKGHEPIEKYQLNQKIELIKKYGRQAARAAHEEAEKPMRV